MFWYFFRDEFVHAASDIHNNPVFFETPKPLVDVLAIISRCFSDVRRDVSPFVKFLNNGFISFIERNVSH